MSDLKTNLNSSASVPWYRSWLLGLTNLGLFLAGMANLAIGTWSATRAESTLAATCLSAGLVLLFAATVDRFETLKGLGLEARTRALKEATSEAAVILADLQAMRSEVAELDGALKQQKIEAIGAISELERKYASIKHDVERAMRAARNAGQL